MDPSYESSDDEAEAMAKAMGFSSFGTQGPPKKRKFNPKTDAMVEGQQLELLDRGGRGGKGSGGNMIPLGKPRVLGTAAVSNQDEIGLDEDDEDKEPDYIDTSLPPPIEQGASEREEGPAYIDKSLSPPDEEARAAQQRIDTILQSSITPSVPSVPPDPKGKGKAQAPATIQGIRQCVAALQNAPGEMDTRLPASTPDLGLPICEPQRQRGQRNEFWYIDYYDPSFNENPWAKLEKAKGLKPKGTWIERGGQAA